MREGEKILQFLFHSIAAGIYGYAAYISPFIKGKTDTYGGELKFFTKWTLYLSILYFISSAIADLGDILTRNVKKETSRFRTFFFAGVLFPCSMITTIVFWGIYSMDPDMMVPLYIRKILPVTGFYNNAVHTAPLFTAIIESLLVTHIPARFSQVNTLWLLYGATYLSWLFWIAYKANIWVYPFLRAMNPLGKGLFFAGVLAFGSVFVKANHMLSLKYHGMTNTDGDSKKRL